ncbi:MAG: transmembrane anchor protein [Pyrinomonadaceae bacterium]|nr:transmembrane anchor protein [Pyrinomonadaceae bacterium]
MYNSDLPTRAELPSSKQLLRSTVIAMIVATVLLVTVVLPSEYGIDPTRIGRVLGLTQMGEIKMALAAEAEKDRTAGASRPAPEQSADASTALSQTPKGADGALRKDEMTVTLKPGEGAEIKLEMSKDAKASYEWASAGGPVNHDTHGDGPGGASHSFSKGRAVERDSGELIAPFDGNHGWFWRNRTETEVTITLKTNGQYRSIKRVV